VPAEEALSALARFENQSADSESRLGLSPNFAMLRRSSADRFHLDSPWNDLSIEITEHRCRLGKRSESEPLFHAEIVGDWVFAAFEAPGAAPRGRLWISDGRGLRSYVP
jgi:hypothetical protein